MTKGEEWEDRLGTSSFNPLDILELQDAVRASSPSVVLSGNRVFVLTYSPGVVHYKPERGFAPCGHLQIDRLLKGI